MRLCIARQTLVRVSLVALLAQTASGQEMRSFIDNIHNFELFNACRPVKPTVVGAKIDRLRALVERRLRNARIYAEDLTYEERASAGSLVVVYGTDGWKFDVSDPDPSNALLKAKPRITATVTFSKQVTDEFGNSRHATTWQSEKSILLPPLIAIEAEDLDRISANGGEGAVSQLVDKFIDEYLRVNGEACGSPVGTQP